MIADPPVREVKYADRWGGGVLLLLLLFVYADSSSAQQSFRTSSAPSAETSYRVAHGRQPEAGALPPQLANNSLRSSKVSVRKMDNLRSLWGRDG